MGDSSRSRPLRERPSDEVSDNRHRQRWTPADTHGRPVAGQLSCDAGSPRLYLASGRRGQCRRSGAAQHGDSRTDLLDPPDLLPNSALLDQARRLRRRGPGVSARPPPWEARPGARRAAPADPADLPGSSGTQIGAARSRLPSARLSRARSSGPSRPAGIDWRWLSPAWPGTGSQGTGAYRGVRSGVNLLRPQAQDHPLGGDAGNLIVRHAGRVRALQGGRQDGTIRAGCRGTAAGHRCGGRQQPGAAAGGLGS